MNLDELKTCLAQDREIVRLREIVEQQRLALNNTVRPAVRLSAGERMALALTMQCYGGGGFDNALGVTLAYANEDNAARIYSAWPELVEKYMALNDTRLSATDAPMPAREANA